MTNLAIYRAERDAAHRAKLRAKAFRADGADGAADTWLDKAKTHKRNARLALATVKGVGTESAHYLRKAA